MRSNKAVLLKIEINPLLQVLPEALHTKDINDPPQVVSCHHQSHIRTGPFLALFCHDITKPPLAFYGTIWMLNNSLSSFVKGFVQFDLFFVILYVFMKFTSVYSLSVW